MDGLINRQTERQTDRLKTDIQTDRQTNKLKQCTRSQQTQLTTHSAYLAMTDYFVTYAILPAVSADWTISMTS